MKVAFINGITALLWDKSNDVRIAWESVKKN